MTKRDAHATCQKKWQKINEIDNKICHSLGEARFSVSSGL